MPLKKLLGLKSVWRFLRQPKSPPQERHPNHFDYGLLATGDDY